MHDSVCPGDFCPMLVLDNVVCSRVMVLWLLTFMEPRLQTPSTAPLHSHEERISLCWESRNKEPTLGWLRATPLLVAPVLGTRGARHRDHHLPSERGCHWHLHLPVPSQQCHPCSHRGKARMPIPLDWCPCGPQLMAAALGPRVVRRGQPGQGAGQIEDLSALLPWHCTKTQEMDGKRPVLGFCYPLMGVQPLHAALHSSVPARTLTGG